MKRLSVILVILAIVLVGCEKKKAPPPEVKPEPTPEQIASEIKAIVAPFQQCLQAGTGFPWETKDQLLQKLQQAKSTHQMTPNGRIAITRVAGEIDDMAKLARDKKRWKMVLAVIEAYEIMDQGTTKMSRLKEKALIQINKPTVTITGWFEDKNDGSQYVFMKVSDPKTQGPNDQPEVLKKRKGEEFNRLRLVDIKGERQGITLEYLDDPGDVYDVYYKGCLQVTIEPDGARAAGAKWRYGGSLGWINSGETKYGLEDGQYTVSFMPLDGWKKPADQTVSVSNGQLSTATGTYSK